jgi:hypothetical protein
MWKDRVRLPRYDQNEPVNKAILIFNEYCDLFDFRDDESRYVFRNGFSRALSRERSHLFIVYCVLLVASER